MATSETNRGRPLPWSLREAIRIRIVDGTAIKTTAREVGVSKNTVKKYITSLTPFRSKEATSQVLST